jgi:hypothetical protein
MLFQNYLQEQQLSSFEDIKTHFEGNEQIMIKEHPSLNLYMVCFSGVPQDAMARECNGTIYEKNTNKLIHHCFHHTYDNFNDEQQDNFFKLNNLNDFTGEIYEKPLIDGSLVRIYYYDKAWHFATSRHMDPKQNFWNKNNFMDLIEESIKKHTFMELETFLSTLDNNYCYTYSLVHPEHRNVYFVETKVPQFILTSKFNVSTLTETYDPVVHGDNRVLNLVDRICDIQNNINLSLKDNLMFFFVKDGLVVDRVKCMNPNFLYAKELKGNHPDLRFRYLELLQTPELNHFMSLFPEYEQQFRDTQEILEKTALAIHKLYLDVKVFKNETDVPKRYEKSIYFLHGKFIKTREKVTKQDSLNSLIMLGKKNSKHLAWILELI